MKKLILFTLPLVLLGACKKDITNLNVDPKNPQAVPSASLFTNAQKTLASALTSSNVNLNIFRLITQQWQETTYTDESNFDLTTRNIPQNVWNTLYRDVLRDLQEAKTVIPTDVTDAVQQKNELAITDIMQVYAWYYLVTTFGNVPYSEALNIDNQFPKYDDAATIYADLMSRLDADLGALDESGNSFGGADILYGGDVAMWKKFGNSFKLKMALTVADVNDAGAKTAAEAAAAAGVFTSNGDNALYAYLASPPNTNPVWVDLVQSGRKDFVANSTLVTLLSNMNDPRITYFFTQDNAGKYSGGNPGASSNYATFSKPSVALTAPDFPADLLDYAEVEFLLAEAAQRGYNVGGTAVDHYTKGVTASIVYWGGTTTQATVYLAQPGVVYNPANFKMSIGVQKWIAFYNRGWDAWIEWRRLDYPKLVAPASAQSDIPVRFTYPVNEQNINRINFEAASTAIGGDDVATKLWWDKY